MRIRIRVHPGSKVAAVGGSHDGALIVRVHERAVDGKATAAALRALASSLGLRAAEVRLVSGATSRTKSVEIPDESAAQVERLLES